MTDLLVRVFQPFLRCGCRLLLILLYNIAKDNFLLSSTSEKRLKNKYIILHLTNRYVICDAVFYIHNLDFYFNKIFHHMFRMCHFKS